MTSRTELGRQRLARSADADRLLGRIFREVTNQSERSRVALVAVGGYGRRELSPHSDLDVVLLHDGQLGSERIGQIAQALWYPVWERKIALDHAVRDLDDMRAAAGSDFRTAMGMLDARSVAGNAEIVSSLRSDVLADWRRDARRRIEELRASREERISRAGWLAYAANPDLKEAGGGLRDAVSLRALVATWLVGVQRNETEAVRLALLDVRDAVHHAAGRRTDKLVPELLPEVAEILGLTVSEVDVYIRGLGRRIALTTTLTWRKLEETLGTDRHRRIRPSGPKIEPVAQGVGVLDGEVVLAERASPESDPELLLRVAAVAATRNLPINPRTVAKLAAEGGPLPEPVSKSSQRLLIEILTSGRYLVDVWETLDIAGLIDTLLPEWAAIRLHGSSSPVHRFTIDRHSIETCVQANEQNREVARPDILVVAALLHDIGKGRKGDHSQVGAPMAVDIAMRWGFSRVESELIGRLVRWHLLLPSVATGRDIEDPLTAINVAAIVQTEEFLDLLAVLTEADALATSESAWSNWRRGLIEGLIAKVRVELSREPELAQAEYLGWPSHVPIPPAGVLGPCDVELQVEKHHGGSLLTIITANRRGVWAQVAGALSVAGLQIRSARLVAVGDAAISLWEVSRSGVDPQIVMQRIRSVFEDRIDLGQRLGERLSKDAHEPRVRVIDAMAQSATLLEVRTRDRRTLLWKVCDTIASLGFGLRSAHMNTYGDEARDVFYVVDGSGHPLSAAEADQLRKDVHQALV